MTQINTVGDSIATHISSLFSGVTAAFEPTEQFDASGTFLCEVYYVGDSQGTTDGDIILGGEIDAYTGVYTISLSRTDGDMRQLITDMTTASRSLNYSWTQAGVDYKRVTGRSITRERMDDSTKSEIRQAQIQLEVTYTESA